MKFYFYSVFFGVALTLSGCGSPSEESSAISIAAYISPTAITLGTLQSTTSIYGTETQTTGSGFMSGSSDSTLFQWSIDEGIVGGSLVPTAGSDSYYTYTAPSQPGIYHVRITDLADNTQMAVCTVTVTN
jgi:hypothetical protein